MKQLPANWWLTWLVRARTRLVEHRALLNRINVFPVPDADTGANLVATVGRAADTAGMADDPSLAAAARAALRGARGNSGTLVSVWLLGLATALDGTDQPSAAQLAAAFAAGHERARTALSDPAEGTALSVMSVLADVPAVGDMAAYLNSLVTAAERTTRETATAEHACNGWVDSGALVLLLVIEQLFTSALNQPVTSDFTDLLVASAADAQRVARAGLTGQKGEPTVEVMCEIHLPVYEVTQLRSALGTVGDSVSIAQVEAGNEALWAIHVHVPAEGDALQLLEAAGQPMNLRITPLVAPEHAAHHADGQL